MAITLVQSKTGTSSGGTVNPTFDSAPASGNLIVLAFIANNDGGSVDSGWTESSNMRILDWVRGFLWWRISNGSNPPGSYTFTAGVKSTWMLMEFSGLTGTPYDVSLSQGDHVGGNTWTTPSLTPTAGDRLIVAVVGGQAEHDESGFSVSSWTNSFTAIGSVGSTEASEAHIMGAAYRTLTADGSTSYSTGATTVGNFQDSQCSLIISFKAAPTLLFALGDYTIEHGLNELSTNCDKIFICAENPTSYANATSGANSLGSKNFGAGNAFGAVTSRGLGGRQVSSVAITDGSITANGTAAVWAAVDSANSRLLAFGTLSGGKVVTNGEAFSLTSLTIGISGTYGS